MHVTAWLSYIFLEMFPQFFTWLDSLMIVEDVSVLGLLLAGTLLVILVGALVARV